MTFCWLLGLTAFCLHYAHQLSPVGFAALSADVHCLRNIVGIAGHPMAPVQRQVLFADSVSNAQVAYLAR
jgi:hypothetical protein